MQNLDSRLRIAIIDYKLGNLFSVKQAFNYLGYNPVITSSPEILLNSDFAVLPGVGAFSDAMNNLIDCGLDEAIHVFVKKGKPFMGVCLGLQLLFTESEEFGNTLGLNIIPGTVRRFSPDQGFKIPQIQWNRIVPASDNRWNISPLNICNSGDFMYFVHSYYVNPASNEFTLSKTEYCNIKYCSAVLADNVFATQFHPEKSGLAGIQIYKQWLEQNNK